MKFTKLSILPLAAMILCLPSCSSEKSNEEAEKKPVVKVQTVTEREVDQIATYTATVEADQINNITSQMPNRIKAIYVDEGMRVSKGQKLVQLDDVNTTTYQLQLDNAKAALRNVEADYNRVVELYKIGGGTKQAVDQMETQLISARNAVASAERALRNQNENTVLTSPVNGVVTARNYDPGDMTGALPILTISQVQPVKIVINVPESDLSRVKVGMPAKVTFDTYGDEVFEGKISLIQPTIDVASRTFGVEVMLPNRENRILPGMFGRVTLNLGVENHVVVPDLAVIKQQGSGNHYVYIYKDGKVHFTFVELGQRIGNTYELLSGVPNGSQVVVQGMAKLADGKEVEVLK